MSRRTINALLAACLAMPMVTVAAPPGAERATPEFPGKPTGPIVVEHRVTTAPTVGVPVKIEISARAAGAISGLGIEARATTPDAVLVTPPVPVAAKNGVYAWEITVVPLAAEAGYLSVIVTGVIDGAPQARNVTISLRSSAPAEPPTVPGKDGESLIALPAEENSH